MKTSNYDFTKDFPIAKATEVQMAKFLVENHDMEYICKVEDVEGARLSDFDIMMKIKSKNKEVTIEIKEDFSCERTGNVSVEFECRGKLSGISISKSDLYLYKVHRPDHKIGVYVTKTSTLKEMIAKKQYFRIVNGGDTGSNSMNYLFKLNVIKDNFILIGIVEK
jgi:hypothetical protein